ncbi:MAG: efflux RND transporter permease subunit, partial [Myxococcota bacterium]|nr:efflux RND transporter permease subunit [Myxococcota bacterium]
PLPGLGRRVGDIASVRFDAADPDTRFLLDGQPTVRLVVGRSSSADSLRVRREVLAILPELQGLVSPGIEVLPSDDYTMVIRDRLKTVAINGLVGALLVALTLILMTGLRPSLLALWGMPVSYMAAILLMKQWGLSINVISSFALLIATGIIVDDAVVVIENVQRHLEMGKKRAEAVLDGTREVLAPVTVAVLTTCFAFMPLALISGAAGRAIRICPLVVIFCLVGSLVEAIFILPGHLAHYAREGVENSRPARLLVRLQALYRPGLEFCIRRRKLVCVLAVLAFVGTMGLSRTMDFSFSAPAKPFQVKVFCELMPGVDRAQSERLGLQVSRVLDEQIPGRVRTHSLRVGSSRDDRSGLVRQGANILQLRFDIDVDAELIQAWPAAVRELRRWLATNPDIASWDVEELLAGPPVGAAVTARLQGRNLDELESGVAVLKGLAASVDGVHSIRDDRGAGKETFTVRVDPDRARLQGLTEDEVGGTVRAAIDGIVAEQLSIDEESVDVLVRYGGARGLQRAGIGDLLLPGPRGPVRLHQVARVDRVRETGFVVRRDGERAISVLADVDREVLNSVKAAEILVEGWDKDHAASFPGLRLTMGGEAEETAESFSSLPSSFLLALVLIYGILAVQFRSYVQPFIILTAVPFGLMGAILGLFFLGYDLSLFAMFGTVALTGIVVNDSLVMIDFINKARASGLGPEEATVLGATQRLRPILTTTLTTCFGLAPLAIGLGGTDGVLAPMAVAISGGLGFATVLVLLVVPAVYLVVEDLRGKVLQPSG